MKITKEQLRKVIQEELENVMHEVSMDDLTDLSEPVEEKLKNLLKAVKVLASRVKKLERSKQASTSSDDDTLDQFKG